MEIAGPRRLERKEWLGRRDERLDAAREVADTVVDIVGVLLLEAVRDGVALHGQQRGNGRDGDLNAVASTVGHVAVDGDELIEPQGEIRAVGALNREVGHERRSILRDRGVARHQEVDEDVDVGTAVAGGYGAHKLKGAPVLALAVTLPQEGVDKLRIFAVAQGLGIETEIHVQGSDMRHVRFVQQQPGDGATDHNELAPVAAEDLPDFDQHRPGGDRDAVVVIGGASRVYFSHGKNSPARCSAASRSRSLPVQRSR